MVVATSTPLLRSGCKKTASFGFPTIDLSEDKSIASEMIVKACEDYGFFKLVNHGVPKKVITRMEREAVDFFSRPALQKGRAGPAAPFGYGCKNIGLNGDKGDLEYILLEANPDSLSQRAKTMSNDPSTFSSVTNDYVSAVRRLTCDILELVAEGLWLEDKCIFSKLISNSQNDSCFRINHYPPFIAPNNHNNENHWDPSSELEEERLHISPLIPPSTTTTTTTVGSKSRLGFGEHTDPQILTILRSNDVSGLQICSHDGFWIPVPPDPNEFFVFVGDSFQALTNGRFTSIRHRVLAINSWKSRMSMMYFAAPALDAWITAPPQINNNIITSNIYRPFTWCNFKQIVYSLRLADNRLDYFKNHTQ
ncbi:unnamed protein product [Withania somnifera]